MYDFAFVVVSYNQERYVKQHLESIRYQIEHYGDGMKIQLVFSDDCSKDNTVGIAKDWLDKHKGLFEKVDIITHGKNAGTIRNMRDGISKMNAVKYKLLACDDLYFKNNIFELINSADIVLTPTISFWDDGKIESFITPDYCQILRIRKDELIDGIRKMLKYNQCIPSPGVFMDKKFWTNNDFLEYIMRFKFIEDIPEWDYIFNQKTEFSFSVDVLCKPYILYRRATGISSKIDHQNANPIDIEYLQIRKEMPAQEDMKPKYLNIYRYRHFWETKVVNKVWLKECERDKSLEDWKSAVNGAQNYLNYIFTGGLENN